MMKVEKENTIGDIVADDYRAASVFDSFGIDFCCKGNRSIAEACEKKKIDADKVVERLNGVMQVQTAERVDYKSWPLDLLADYIEKKHHRYVEEKIPVLLQYLAKIAKVHGDAHPELIEINEIFIESAGEFTKHMKKEELVLFPFIRKMVKNKMNHATFEAPNFGTVKNPIATMMQEHEDEGDRFEKINQLSQSYTLAEDACNTYRVSFALLDEFEKDLHQHIHLENNILFPRAMKLEQEFLTSSSLN